MTAVRTANTPFRPDWRVLVALGLGLMLSAYLFFDLIEDMIEDPLVPLDTWTFETLRSLRTAGLDAIMIAVTQLGDTVVVVLMTTAVALWLLRQGAWRAALYWLTAVAGASAINTAIKAALARPRPTELYLTGASVWSFPSGHSTVNAVLYGFLALMIVRQITPVWRLPVAVTTVLLIGLIAFSRLYLGAHWLSDVAGGLAFGAMWLTLLGLFYMYRRAEPIAPKGLLIVAAATLVIAGGGNILLNHGSDTAKYSVKIPSPEPVR